MARRPATARPLSTRHLLEYVIAGDAEAAAAVMREHIDTSLGAQAAWRLRKHHTDADSPIQDQGPGEGDA